MNERIRELKKQATKIVETTDHCTGVSESRIEVDLEKFAELIVRECADVAKYYTPDTEECEHTWLIHDKIKQHFRVEQ